MKIGVLGSGVVGEALANGALEYGHDVVRASRDPSKLEEWRVGSGDRGSTGTFKEAASWAELVILAVKGSAAEAAVELCDAASLAGKPVIDTTNPIAEAPPVNGVLEFFTGPNDSLLERIQSVAPEAKLVKAFSCVGHAFMVNPDFGDQTPTMFICGNDAGAKNTVTDLLTEFGWETADMGAAEAARAIEPLCMLWCIPGFRDNSWTHAFKLLRK